MDLIYLVLILNFIFSSSTDQFLVKSIKINGNQTTKKIIIEREINQKIGFHSDSLIIIEDRNRLYNLGIFSSVDINLKNNIYVIDVVESYKVYPWPLISYDEIKKELSYGPGISLRNFFGRNQTFIFGTYLVGEKGYLFSYSNPWVSEDRINIGFKLYNLKQYNIFYNYNYDFFLNQLTLGFSNDVLKSYDIHLGLMQTDIKTLDQMNENYQYIKSKSLKNKYIFLGLNYQFDNRDIYIDPSSGNFFDLFLKYYKGYDNSIDISDISLKYKKYFSIDVNTNPVISIGTNLVIKFPSYNKLPIYFYEYLGGEDYIRGYSSFPSDSPAQVFGLIETSNIIYFDTEIQNTIIPKKDYGKFEFGIDGILFCDIGSSADNYKSLTFDEYLIGYGFGLKLFISSTAIGFYFGFNPYNQTHFHVKGNS